MPEFKVLKSLREIDSALWDQCFSGLVEDYGYLLAVEEAGIAGFQWRYLTVWDSENLIGAMPFFLTDYKLDTTLQGAGKKITNGISRAFPKLLTHRLASIGSPCTETALIGFADGVDRPALFKSMLEYFEKYAAGENCKLLGIKDIPANLAPEFEAVFKDRKYSVLPGMPAAVLPINFETVDEYIGTLSQKMRKDLRRKMRSFNELRIEHHSNIDDVFPDVFKLYLSTYARSDWQFEELTEEYFKNVLANMPGKSFCTLYYAYDELLAANLLIHDEHILLDKFFCMGERGKHYNVYFLSWLTNIQTCIDRGFKRYESGQAYDEMKLRLGSRLSPNNMYFKHRNAITQGLLRLVAPLLAADDTKEISREAA